VLFVAGGLREAAARVDQRRPEQHRLSLPGAQRGHAQPREDTHALFIGSLIVRGSPCLCAFLNPFLFAVVIRDSAAAQCRPAIYWEQEAEEVQIRRTTAARRWKRFRQSRGTGSAATAESPVLTGPPSTWASRCASSAREYTGRHFCVVAL